MKKRDETILRSILGGRGGIKLQTDSNHKPLKIAANVAAVLAQHPAWKGGPRFDEFRREAMWPEGTPLGKARPIEDSDAAEVQSWLLTLDFSECVEAGLDVAWAGIELAAKRAPFDSLQEHVEAMRPWDGQSRSLVDYLACDKGLVERTICRRWLVGAMARVFRPGSTFGGMLVLEGAQESYKNRGMEALFGSEYIALLGGNKPGTREADMLAESTWGLHDDEFRQTAEAMDAVKSWATKTKNSYRPPYGRTTIHVERRCVHVASTNRVTYLEDDENRRFWPVKIHGRIDVDGLSEDREMIWGEARAAFEAGEPWWISPDDAVREDLRQAQAERVTRDLLTDSVASAIEIHFADVPSFSLHQIAEKLAMRLESRDRGMQMRLGRIVKDLGYVRFKARVFGDLQWCYRKREQGVTGGNE